MDTDKWDTIGEAKLAVKVWIIDRGESWGPITDSDKRRMRMVSKNRPHTCPPSTHHNFHWANSAEYLEYKLRRDIALNPRITPMEMNSRLDIHHHN